jgi:hypothetical protein
MLSYVFNINIVLRMALKNGFDLNRHTKVSKHVDSYNSVKILRHSSQALGMKAKSV